MPTDTPTAQQLWEQTDQYRREGGPGMPRNLEHYPTPKGGAWFSCCGLNEFQVDDAHAAAILRDHGRTWLEENFFAPQTWKDISGSYGCRLRGLADADTMNRTSSTLYKTMLAAINAAIGAVLDAKEGE